MPDKKPDRNFFDEVYKARDAEQTRALYDDWAKEYDNAVGGAGYATPLRMAQALAALTSDLSAPVLDFGCGTGVSGVALHQVGFSCVDGMDVAEQMLQQAHAKSVYRALDVIEPGAALPVERGAYGAIQACGVIGAGAAPVQVLDQLLDLLETGQKLSFSLNDHALADPETSGYVDSFRARSDLQLLTEDYGDHLPELGLKSVVYIFERR